MEANCTESGFFDFLLQINRPYLHNFASWVFYPGMLFNSPDKWWGDKKQRKTPHEGIDLCYFKDQNGEVIRIPATIKIPSTFSGTIVKIEDDFLGKSIFLGHNIFSQDRRQLFTLYGHTQPLDAIMPMRKVAAGEIIATIAALNRDKVDIHPHLHITFAWVPAAVNVEQLNWQNLANTPGITLLDPLSILAPATNKAEFL